MLDILKQFPDLVWSVQPQQLSIVGCVDWPACTYTIYK